MNGAGSLEAVSSLVGGEVVLDMSSRYVVLGRLESADSQFLKLTDADVHDLRDTSTTRDSYVLEARQHGISVGRASVWVRTDDIVALSRLTDVVI